MVCFIESLQIRQDLTYVNHEKDDRASLSDDYLFILCMCITKYFTLSLFIIHLLDICLKIEPFSHLYWYASILELGTLYVPPIGIENLAKQQQQQHQQPKNYSKKHQTNNSCWNEEWV